MGTRGSSHLDVSWLASHRLSHLLSTGSQCDQIRCLLLRGLVKWLAQPEIAQHSLTRLIRGSIQDSILQRAESRELWDKGITREFLLLLAIAISGSPHKASMAVRLSWLNDGGWRKLHWCRLPNYELDSSRGSICYLSHSLTMASSLVHLCETFQRLTSKILLKLYYYSRYCYSIPTYTNWLELLMILARLELQQ